MTNEDIIRMAREAGWTQEYLEFGDVRLERFATIVAAAEREACAKVCKQIEDEAYERLQAFRHLFDEGREHGAMGCAAAIRARGEKK